MKDLRLVKLAKTIARSLGFESTQGAPGERSVSTTTAPRSVIEVGGNEPNGGSDPNDPQWINLESIGPRSAVLVRATRKGDRS